MDAIEHLRGFQLFGIALRTGRSYKRSLRRMSNRPRIWLTPFHEIEFHHAIAQSIFRGRFDDGLADEIIRDFERDRDSGVWLRADFPEVVFKSGILFAKAYIGWLGCRTLDTLHVASALELDASEFWTFDERQARLARAVGLNVVS